MRGGSWFMLFSLCVFFYCPVQRSNIPKYLNLSGKIFESLCRSICVCFCEFSIPVWMFSILVCHVMKRFFSFIVPFCFEMKAHNADQVCLLRSMLTLNKMLTGSLPWCVQP